MGCRRPCAYAAQGPDMEARGWMHTPDFVDRKRDELNLSFSSAC
jgi:hypothetical protein